MITINVYEKSNHLYADDQTKPIVCGNTNYQIKFEFESDFASLNNKIAVLVIGDKKMAVDFEGTTLALPALPNGSEVKLMIMSAESKDLELVSSVLTLALKPTLEADNLNEFEPISNYVSAVITRINGLLDGSLAIYSTKVAENVSNPNLLINGDFKVNQRGESSYSTAGAYTVDRWKLVSGSLVVEDNGITLNGTITQTLENPPIMDVVASVDTSGGDVTATYSNGVFSISTTAETLITWVKLEVGTSATVFSPKTYAEELANCQRYYQKITATNTYGPLCFGFTVTNSNAYAIFHMNLRTTPTIAYGGTIAVRDTENNIWINVSAITYDQMSNNLIRLLLTLSSTASAGLPIDIAGRNDKTAFIEFDSEIY